MPTIIRRNVFQRICPHVWRTTEEKRVVDPLDPNLLIGIRTYKTCTICGTKYISDVQ